MVNWRILARFFVGSLVGFRAGFRISFLYFTCFVCVTSPSSLYASEPAQPEQISLGNYPVVIAYLNKYISYLVDEEDLSGLSIAIVNEQNIVWEKGFRFADKELEIPSKPDTVYQVGAVTGLLTSALVVSLVEKGLLNLDDDIKKYLPDLVIHSRETDAYKKKVLDNEQNKTAVITIRNLLTHHAGLPINVFKNSWAKEPLSFHSLLSPSTELKASYPPETIYAFSNVGYSLLGVIIERVSGLSFSSAMQKYVFTPLNMSSSSVDNGSQLMKTLAIGYKDGDAGEKLLPRDTPSIGLVTTVKDLSRFIRLYFQNKPTNLSLVNRSLINGSLINRSLVNRSMVNRAIVNSSLANSSVLAETIRVQNAEVKLDIGRQVGFSWYLDGMDVKNAGTVLWRGGATPYYRSRVAMLPEYNLGVVILSNDSKSWEVIEKVSEKALQLMFEAKTGISQLERPLEGVSEKQPKTKLEDEQTIKDENLKIISDKNLNPDKFANAYSSFVGYLKVIEAGGEYQAEVLGWPFLLTRDKNNDDWFELQYDLLGFIPIDISWISGIKVRPAIVDSHRVLILYYKARQYLFGQYLMPQKIHAGWESLAGEYQVKNGDTLLDTMKVEQVELKLKDNRIYLLYQLPVWFGMEVEIPLKTLSDTEAIIPGLGTGLNETVTVSKIEGKHLLEYSGYYLQQKQNVDSFIEFDFFD